VKYQGRWHLHTTVHTETLHEMAKQK